MAPRKSKTITCPPRIHLPTRHKMEYPPTGRNETFERRSLMDDDHPPKWVLANSEEEDEYFATVAKFKKHGFVCKYGKSMTIAEGQMTRFIGTNQKLVTVPKVIGWREYDGRLFLYMSYIEDPTLWDKWSSLSQSEQELLCVELENQLVALQDLDPQQKQTTTNPEDLRSRVYPFNGLTGRLEQMREAVEADKSRGHDDSPPYVIRHPDINRTNVFVRKQEGRWRISCIGDWDNAGWFPRPFTRLAGLDALKSGKFP